jgi:DNA-directed RNA polymerase subunit RPC12/RpoP
MAGVVRSIEDLSRKGADLLIRCHACGHDRTVPIHQALDIFRRRLWSTDWWAAHRRFRCRKCGSKDIKLDADFYGHAVRRQRRPAVLAAVEETLRPGLKPPPPSVPLAEWNRATEAERKRLVDRARS